MKKTDLKQTTKTTKIELKMLSSKMPPCEDDCSQKTILFSQNSMINMMCQFFLRIVIRKHSMLCFCERIRKSVLFISLVSFNEHMGGITSRRFTLQPFFHPLVQVYFQCFCKCNYFLYSNMCATLGTKAKTHLDFQVGRTQAAGHRGFPRLLSCSPNFLHG